MPFCIKPKKIAALSSILYLLPFVLFFLASCGPRKLITDVLVIGGGTGGTAAGIQSARLGVKTIIAEPTTWLGGMISSAGVSAFDGNHNIPSGIWAEFREKIYQVYGGPGKVATGWVSNTQFEPHVADSILKDMCKALPDLRVLFQYQFKNVIWEDNKISGAVFTDVSTGRDIRIYARQVIDATELGDVMAAAGIPFDQGMEAGELTGEPVGVPASNNIIQDLTYVAVLKDYGPAADCTIVRPALYDPGEFDCCCNTYCSDTSVLFSNVTAPKMLDYGKLPGNKYMINWPSHGNDIYLNIISAGDEERKKELEKAKDKTRRFVYFIQTQLGFKNLGLADDEFPTPDRLALIPYHREGRRLKGMVRLQFQDIADPFNQDEALFRTGISVGDYPIDHHHRENPTAPQHLHFYPVPSFNVPMGSLIPKEVDGIIIAEKGISVSNVVNGTTRLQPCVMLTGQAAGILAALAVLNNQQPRNMPVRMVQQKILEARGYIMPYYDVPPDDPHFMSIQKTGATGILKGTGEPYKWANRTWFYPDSAVLAQTFEKDIAPFTEPGEIPGEYVTISQALQIISHSVHPPGNRFSFNDPAAFTEQVRQAWPGWALEDFNTGRKITRRELAVLLDKTIDPFGWKQPGLNGNYTP